MSPRKSMLGWAILVALTTPLPALAQDAGTSTGSTPAEDQATIQALGQELEALKSSYAQEVQRLRELDARVQALQSRLAGRTAGITQPAPALPAQPVAPTPADDATHAGTAEQARLAREQAPTRSVEDVLQQEHAVFDRKLTLESGISYNRYDRKQLTLNGFLALDAIFLGNIAIENVESDSLTYTFAARYGLNPRLSLNVEVPYLARNTTYQKGGAGGAAAVIAEEKVFGTGLGDVNASLNYRLFTELGARPDTVLTFGVTAPTGRSPYGVDWRVLERDDDDYIRFAVPDEQPTGNGVWTTSLGLSAVKTMDPAIVFANFGVSHSFQRDFDDLDSNPDTVNPGSVQLGNSYYYGAGVAFAFNERTSLSMSFSHKLSAKAKLRGADNIWQSVIGSDANAATFNLGLTYALSQHTTLVSMLGIGLTPDAPDLMLTVKVPYIM